MVIGENKITPQFPNEALSIDITYMQPAFTGDKYILSIMDMYSRFTKFYPLRDMYADTISERIASHCCDHGFPKIIFTDDFMLKCRLFDPRKVFLRDKF